MKHENYSVDGLLPSRAQLAMPQTVRIEQPGSFGSGLVSLPSCKPIGKLWPSRQVADKLVLDGVIEVMGAVLASDLREPLDVAEFARMHAEFEELEFKAPLDVRRDIEVMVRVQSRYGAMIKGIFVASQGAFLIVAGKLVLTHKRLA
jgi:hypothetical protein